MSGLRRLDSDFGSFKVADFADHDHVRILTQKAAQGCGEGHAAFLVLLHLVDAGQTDFHRVFDRGNVALFFVENAECGVQRHRLARARWTSDQHHAVGFSDCVEKEFLLVRLVAQFFDAELRRAAVENTQHDLLAEQCRQSTDAEIDLPGFGQIELDAPVLRHAFFGDVQLRHDFETRGDALAQFDRSLGDLFEDAVDAQPYAIVGLVRLEMDIRGASADRIHQHLVDELHDRGIVVLAVDTAIAAGLVVAAGDVEIVQALGVVQIPQRIVGLHPQLHGALDGVLINEDGLYQQVGVELDFVEGSGVGRIGNTDKQAATTFEERQHVVFLQQFLFDQPDRTLA